MRRLLFCLALIALSPASRIVAQQLVDFPICLTTQESTPVCPYGTSPGTLIQAADGTLYGTTTSGGANNAGALFRVSTLGSYQLLYSFCSQKNCADGSAPNSLIYGTDGNLYGTTMEGTVTLAGSVFRLAPTGVFTTLYRFCSQAANCPDGRAPGGGLVEGADGKLYGTTLHGGNQYDGGVAYSLTKSGVLTVLHDFCTATAVDQNGVTYCTDAANPSGALLQAADGMFYGTSAQLYSGDYFFETYPNLYTFTSTGSFTSYPYDTGGVPMGNLLQTSTGSIFGASSSELNFYSPYSLIYSFSPNAAFYEASSPVDFNSPVLDSDGNFLTIQKQDTGVDAGSILSISPGAVATTLFDQPGTFEDISVPLVQGGDGNLYGIDGNIFSFSPATPFTPPVEVSASSTTVTLGQSLTLRWSIHNAFSATMQRCEGFLNGQPEGLVPLTGSYTFKPTTIGSYAAGITCGGVESGYVTIRVTNGSPVNTATSLKISPTPIPYGSPMTLTSTVSFPRGVGYPVGVVDFYTGSQLLGAVPLVNGYGSLQVDTASFGISDVPVVAKYVGDSTDSASTSPTVNAVIYSGTTTSLTATPSAVTAGQPVTLQAAVNTQYGSSGYITAGTVSFYYGSFRLGQAPLQQGVATFTASSAGLPSGIYPITAVYSGAQNYAASTSSVVNVTVDQ